MSELFVIATRNQFRFETVRGHATVEDLWIMPLKNSPEGFDLNSVARALSKKISEASEEDFVSSKVKVDETLVQQLDIIKYIIKDRLDDIKKAKEEAENKALRSKAREILARREDSKLEELSDKELRKLAK